jgi:hypothetical protein
VHGVLAFDLDGTQLVRFTLAGSHKYSKG